MISSAIIPPPEESNSAQFGNDLTSEEESSIGESGLDSSGALHIRWVGWRVCARLLHCLSHCCLPRKACDNCATAVDWSAVAAARSVPYMLLALCRPCFGHILATRIAVIPPNPDRHMPQVVVREILLATLSLQPGYRQSQAHRLASGPNGCVLGVLMTSQLLLQLQLDKIADRCRSCHNGTARSMQALCSTALPASSLPRTRLMTMAFAAACFITTHHGSLPLP